MLINDGRRFCEQYGSSGIATCTVLFNSELAILDNTARKRVWCAKGSSFTIITWCKENTPELLTRYQLTMGSAGSKLDDVVGEDLIMLPSNMELQLDIYKASYTREEYVSRHQF
ncbi:hypothetical protein CHS0354_005323 [Potamilus streckersoni]|uniref:Uncharacterized protein n=1 Tax=Potamilus streckersoni TaxID=2493646 RepID=A0AAE0SGQ8_9BIVA|nr:hypothetical protein CHS0354_005323 [Potamilus streckersoni]